MKRYRGVEQLVARRAHNPEVAGSNPVPATTIINPEISSVGYFEVFLVLKVKAEAQNTQCEGKNYEEGHQKEQREKYQAEFHQNSGREKQGLHN